MVDARCVFGLRDRDVHVLFDLEREESVTEDHHPCKPSVTVAAEFGLDHRYDLKDVRLPTK